jgi:alpha/beta superfamily hydrolase
MKRAHLRIPGPAGMLETVVNDPGESRRGIAYLAHPHPLHGGTLDNKVVQTLAQTAHDLGLVAVRPNFRGVGKSEGAFGHGVGEVADMQAVIDFVNLHYPALPLWLAGFSFGAYVQHRIAAVRAHQKLLLVAPAVNLHGFGAVDPARSLVLVAEQDELVPPAAIHAWTQEYSVPTLSIAGSGHFFHGKLGELAQIVKDTWTF